MSKNTTHSKSTKDLPAKKQEDTRLSVKITLEGIRPAIWRRIAIEPNTTLESLHYTIQAAMGWYNSHLHTFKAGPYVFSDLNMEIESWTEQETKDEARTTIGQIIAMGFNRLTYEYDFGDGWIHSILIEKKRVASDAPKGHTVLLAGERACPPEDCGGTWGYVELIDKIQDPSHPEHEEILEWVGGEFDPEAFLFDEAAARVQKN